MIGRIRERYRSDGLSVGVANRCSNAAYILENFAVIHRISPLADTLYFESNFLNARNSLRRQRNKFSVMKEFFQLVVAQSRYERFPKRAAISFLLRAHLAWNRNADRIAYFSCISNHSIFQDAKVNDTLETRSQIDKDVLRSSAEPSPR